MRLPWEYHDQSQETNWRHCVTGPELPLFHKRKGILKIDQSVKMPWHRLSMGVACSWSSAPATTYPLCTIQILCITRCFCSCAVWRSALWGQGSRRANCFKMPTRKRARRAEVFYRNLERGVRLKDENIRKKIPEKMDQEKFYAIEERSQLFDRNRVI